MVKEVIKNLFFLKIPTVLLATRLLLAALKEWDKFLF
jgi:hypothetical protein